MAVNKTVQQKALEYVPSGLSRKDTATVIKELKAIESEHGIIQPLIVVEKAKTKGSPLHKFFEWNNHKAADQFRLWQARQLVASVYVRDAASENAIPIRAFVNVKLPTEDDSEAQGYVSAATALRSPPLQQQVLTYAKDQLLAWRKRFGAYEQFFGVVKAIDEIVTAKEDAA